MITESEQSETAKTLPGDLIREARNRRGFTQRRLAALVGVTPSYLCQLERNRTRPTVKMAGALEEQLGLTPGRLGAGGARASSLLEVSVPRSMAKARSSSLPPQVVM